MSSNSPTRRRVLQGAGVAIASALAGCGAESSAQQSTTTNATQQSGTDTPTDASSQSSAEAGRYTEIYRQTIGSVVLIQTTTSSGQGGQGSGFVYRDNYVVTNAHVVSGASEVQVRFTEGEWRSASVVGTAPSADLAVIQIENVPDYATPLPMVENQPPIGTRVMAIGNPYGFEGSVTSGLISGVNRSIPAPNGYRIPDAIQTGAPVNPGNSGGPLLSLNGEVVGVISSGGGENLAFAVSAALVKRVVPALIEDGEFTFPYMGVNLATVTPRIAEQIGLDQPRGVLVSQVQSGGPSAGALQSGDVIVSIGGRQVDGVQQLSSYLALQASPGDTVEVTVLRNGERRTVELTLGERPERTNPGS